MPRRNPSVPDVRLRAVNTAPIRSGGDYVVYWMTAARRTRYNFALQRAIELARELGVGVVVLEALRLDYPWASERLHRFVVEGMRDNAASCERAPVTYYPFVERTPGDGKGLLAALAERACAVIADDFPCFFLPRMLATAAAALPVRVEAVDGNGLYPMYATERVFTTAASFRRHLHKELPPHLGALPTANPLARLELPRRALPAAIARRWRPELPSDGELAALAFGRRVAPVATRGGARAAHETLTSFLRDRLARYPEQRNEPEIDAQSHLSPYLHFGHISAHEVFVRLMELDDWSPARLAPAPTGSRSGWWGASTAVEAFLDELVTWREIGYNRCARDERYAAYESLPSWATQTLAKHSRDPRQYVYELAQLERAETHDPLWNAAQRQLLREGTIHNYLRMLWGKKILEWTRSPHDALAAMVELNNAYALDGRNPNSYSGIFWVLGRYDRAWGPERPVFGKVRYMSSDNTARKVRVKGYLARYAA